jgi:hypothetical protein
MRLVLQFLFDQESKQLKDEEQESDAEEMGRYDKAMVTEKKELDP